MIKTLIPRSCHSRWEWKSGEHGCALHDDRDSDTALFGSVVKTTIFPVLPLMLDLREKTYLTVNNAMHDTILKFCLIGPPIYWPIM